MSIIFPIILIVVSVIVIGIIVFRKYTQITLLDVQELPEVKENEKKDQILRKRATEKSKESKKIRLARVSNIRKKYKNIQTTYRSYVGNIKKQIEEGKVDRQSLTEEPVVDADIIPLDDIQDVNVQRAPVDMASTKGFDFLQRNDLEAAEKKFIEAIRLDNKYVPAYIGLADVYAAQKQFDEAQETYTFALQLEPTNDMLLEKLADLHTKLDNSEKAIDYMQQAVLANDSIAARFAKLARMLYDVAHYSSSVEAWKQAAELDPVNKEYLDKLIETAILVPDRELAEEYLSALRKLDHENPRLDVLKDKIASISE